MTRLSLVLTLSVALTLIGCTKKSDESSSQTELVPVTNSTSQPQPSESTTPVDPTSVGVEGEPGPDGGDGSPTSNGAEAETTSSGIEGAPTSSGIEGEPSQDVAGGPPEPGTPKEAAPESTEEPEAPEEILMPDPMLSIDLLAYHQREVRGLTAEQIMALNEDTIQKLYQLPNAPTTAPPHRLPKINAITPELGQQLINSMDKHPVVSFYASSQYDQPGTNIGYCFGRATYAHLALLKMGVAKQSIRKIWIVGPMYSASIQWAFHVAVVVRTTNNQWMVVDNYSGRLLEIRDWLKIFYPMNKDHKNLRLYVTDPAKFSVSLGKYDRVQLGLDLPEEQDWYRHYFFDLMQWFKEHKMSELGLPVDLRRPQN